MKIVNKTTLAIVAAMGSVASVNAAIIFTDDFSTNTLAADYIIQNVNYNSTPETVGILRSGGSNFLQIKDTFDLDSANTTELTVSFDWSFGNSMFGSGFLVEYNDNAGTGWQTIATQGYNASGADDTGSATNPLTVTITEGGTYAFTNNAAIRIIGTANSGSKAYYIDNLNVEVDVAAVPEPSSTPLLALGGLALILRRRK